MARRNRKPAFDTSVPPTFVKPEYQTIQERNAAVYALAAQWREQGYTVAFGTGSNYPENITIILREDVTIWWNQNGKHAECLAWF